MKPKTLAEVLRQQHHDDAFERMFEAFQDPDKTPTARARAAFAYRYEGLVATGLDRLTGAGGTYHLATDFAAPVVRLCRVLAGEDDFCGYGTPQAKSKFVVDTLAWRLGFRWTRGCQNLCLALKERGVDPVQTMLFTSERMAFAGRISRLLDAVQALLDERQPEAALANAQVALAVSVEEVHRLAEWLALAGNSDAVEAREASKAGSRYLASYDARKHRPDAKTRSRR